MTERQTIAYTNPCTRGWDTMKPEFRRFIKVAGYVYSTILTVNK